MTTYGTRGVKFKFSEGDKVLCYEPDPTKAKVLYESKVLETVVSKDSRGRKVAEYRVHFQGWNSSWDRCVREDFVLQINPENRLLQKKLAHDAAIHLKGKKRKKLPALFRESMKKGCYDSDDENDTEEDGSIESNQDTDDMKDDDEEEEEEKDGKHVFPEIKLTDKLKEKLEDDCFLITAKNKLVNLPCEPNIVRILERYVKQTAYNLLYSTPMKGNRHQSRGSNASHTSDIETKINLSKELVDGIRIFFDFTLPLSLLYREEKQQYETINNLVINSTPSPIPSLPHLSPNKDDSDERNGEHKRSRTPGEDSIPWHSFQPLSPTPVTPSNSSVNSQPSSPSFSNAIFNNGQNNTPSSPLFQSSKLGNGLNLNRNSLRSANNGGTNSNDTATTQNNHNVSSRTRLSSRSQSLLRDRQSPSSSIEDGASSKRVLRSSDRQREKLRLDQSLFKNDQNSNDTTISDVTGGNGSASPSMILKNLSANTVIAVVTNPSRAISPPTNANLPSLSMSSSASSTHSDSTLKAVTVNSKRDVFTSATRLRDHSGVLNEVLHWQLLPQQVYEEKPVTPSIVYGAQHLLRLFVVLPDYLSRMNMTRRKRNTLVDGMKSFIKYLDDSCSELFPDSATYKDLDELSGAKN